MMVGTTFPLLHSICSKNNASSVADVANVAGSGSS